MVTISSPSGKHRNFSGIYAIQIIISANAEYASTEMSVEAAGHEHTTVQVTISVKNRIAFIYRKRITYDEHKFQYITFIP